MSKHFSPDTAVSEIIQAMDEVARNLVSDGSQPTWTREIKRSLCKLGHEYGFPVAATGAAKETDTDNDAKLYKPEWGEWHYDLCWLDYQRNAPDEDLRTHDNFLVRIPLAMECEWGNFGSINEDFEKLLVSRAVLKVMIFQETGRYDFDAITAHLCRYIETFAGPVVGDRYLLLGFVGDRFHNRVVAGSF